MKKLFEFAVLCAAVCITILSCSKENTSGDEPSQNKAAIEAIKHELALMEQTIGQMKTAKSLLDEYLSEVTNGTTAIVEESDDLAQSVKNLAGNKEIFAKELDEMESWYNSVKNDINAFTAQGGGAIEQFNAISQQLSTLNTSILTIKSQMFVLNEETAKIAIKLDSRIVALSTLLSQCQNDVENLKITVKSLEDDVENIKKQIETIVGGVQSIVVVPDFSNGSVKISDVPKDTIDFEVYPLTAAEAVAAVGVSAFDLQYVETKTSSRLAAIDIKQVFFKNDLLSVVVDGSSLPDEIKKGDINASVRLRVHSGNVDRSSGYFHLTYKASVPPSTGSDIAVTGEASHITCRGARLSGKVNLPEKTYIDLELGVLYSRYPGILFGKAEVIVAQKLDEKFNFVVQTPVLDPETTYYFRTFFTQNGEVFYGEVKSFTTKTVASLIQTEDVSVNVVDAVLNASLDTTDCNGKLESYGFKLYLGNILKGTFAATDYDGRKYSYKVLGLDPETSYNVIAIVTISGRQYTGETKTFTLGGYRSFNATVPPELKSTLSPEGKISWESGDVISVNGSKFTAKTGGTTAVFSSDTPVRYTGKDSPRYKAVFPASIEVSLGKYVLPPTQPHSSKSVNIPMYAQSDDNNLTFNTMCGLLCFSFANATSVKKVQITTDKAINGEFTIDADGTAVIKSGSNTTTIDCGHGAPATDKFYIPIPAGTYNSLNLIAIDDKENPLKTSISTPLTIKRGTVTNLGILKFPELVDLGLSVKWASCNLGASKPEEYGGYYEWAGTRDVKNQHVDWSTCPYHKGYNGDAGWTKYIPSRFPSYWSGPGRPDNKTVLEPGDDAANVKMGGKWHIPTRAEWTELKDNCTWTSATLNGVNGYRVTGKKPGYTDKSIFLPAAGYRSVDRLVDVSTDGYYRSSEIWTDNPHTSWSFWITPQKNRIQIDHISRFEGVPIRPVSK